MNIAIGRTYRTRDGRTADVLERKSGTPWPMPGRIWIMGEPTKATWLDNGDCNVQFTLDPRDIVEDLGTTT